MPETAWRDGVKLPHGATRIAEIHGYDGSYWITDNGKVWSRKGRGRWLKPGVGPRMYYKVDLCVDGKPKTRKIHRLVLQTFHGEPEPGQVAIHINGDRRDNRLENLKWGSRGETMWPLMTAPIKRYTRDSV